jgi:hypothetical protein
VNKLHSHMSSLNRAVLAAALAVSLAGCDTIGGITGSSIPPTADPILLDKAQEREALAQRSLKEADEMIEAGQKQQADGQAMMLEGNKKVALGTQLKAEAERQLGVSSREVQEMRARVETLKAQEGARGDSPPPQPNPRPSGY